jgi:serine incorporator 1/3
MIAGTFHMLIFTTNKIGYPSLISMFLFLLNAFIRVEKSNKAELEKSGSGRKWLASILVFSAIFFVGAFGGLIYMFFEFTGCVTNNLFISLTLIFCVALPIAQMAGGEGSLLSVACISAWATYLCYTAVSKNPDASCNPRFGDSSPISIAFGLAITLLSLAWAGWSYTAEDKLTDHNATNAKDEPTSVKTSEEELEDGIQPKRAVTGVVVMQSGTDTTSPDEIGNNNNVESTPTDDSNTESVRPLKASNAWKLNVALAVVSCWSAMTLTQWGVIQSKDGTIANRDIGNVGMWVIIGSQWFVLTLYLWTLVAPRLFPNRDFS